MALSPLGAYLEGIENRIHEQVLGWARLQPCLSQSSKIGGLAPEGAILRPVTDLGFGVLGWTPMNPGLRSSGVISPSPHSQLSSVLTVV